MCTKSFCPMMADGKFVKFDEGGCQSDRCAAQEHEGQKIIFNYWRTGNIASAIRARVTGILTSDVLNVESVKKTDPVVTDSLPNELVYSQWSD